MRTAGRGRVSRRRFLRSVFVLLEKSDAGLAHAAAPGNPQPERGPHSSSSSSSSSQSGQPGASCHSVAASSVVYLPPAVLARHRPLIIDTTRNHTPPPPPPSPPSPPPPPPPTLATPSPPPPLGRTTSPPAPKRATACALTRPPARHLLVHRICSNGHHVLSVSRLPIFICLRQISPQPRSSAICRWPPGRDLVARW